MEKLSSGISGLDNLIDYIYPGDNVVWEVDAGTSYEIFIKKFIEAACAESNDIVYISFNKSVPTLLKEFGNCINEKFHIIDSFTSGKGKNDATFLRNYEELSKKIHIVKLSNPSNLDELTNAITMVESKISSPTAYIFDSLTGMQNLIKDESLTYSFFTYMCPRLFDLDSVAYWIVERDAHSQKFKANIRHITQVVLELYRRKDSLFLKALKLSRRKNREAFKPHMYEVTDNDEIHIKATEQTLVLDIGNKLREIRISRNISQKELAEKVNLTPGFISQMENNQIAPSIVSFMQICDALGVKASEILNETKTEEKFLIKKKDILAKLPQKISSADIYRVLSDENFQAYLIMIPPNSSIKGHFLTKKEPEIVFLIKGEVSVRINNSIHSLQEGDFFYIKKSMPEQWQNKGGDKAELLVISR
ncbi:helix-turn-helix domain-containing protein [Thermodesulfovibrio yellowstonii]|uniref:helix-turn-helix domain-containing protein n=1 Tax=Thermodesulfovibrio yellowstonii TaxID=28262 RepID=UPI0004019232|nr:helix-turn-helix domain-containing protein [Thermodesulfovibrio islandicus]